MSGVLAPSQRRLLEQVVAEARDVVEAACAQRVAALGVADDRVSGAMSESDRRLRRGLRARARQLGSVDALISEAGFEHWHRMLFARFLADNELLVDDVAGQPVSVEELAEVAAELGEPDQWEVAARFATAMLPGIFRVDDPVLHMRLPAETRQRLEDLLATLPSEVLTADDALGWVYQYWQARRKDEVNRSERKIGGADLAPVTQLFTEDYMVRFLLENSLGAWWASRHPDSPLLAEWDYLRLTDDGVPAAGTFEEWPTRAVEVTVMDPCCGSGHFLVAAFGMLWRMRVEEEGALVADAQNAVLRENLFGLELDPRCTQIAAFALAMEAWRTGGYRQLPLPNVACSGTPAKAPLEDWTNLAAGDALVESALGRLHALFANADTLGSLIDPVRASEDAGLESVDWSQIAPLVQLALTAETGEQGDDPAAAVFGEAAAGIARAAAYLSRNYTLTVTNVPYLKRGNQTSRLAAHVDAWYASGSADLATAMALRCLRLLEPGGESALVTPQAWTSTTAYKDLRAELVRRHAVRLVGFLGAGAFRSISGEVVNVALALIRGNSSPRKAIFCIDGSTAKSVAGKAQWLRRGAVETLPLDSVARDPDLRFLLLVDTALPLLSEFAACYQGMATADYARYGRRFWELSVIEERWSFQQSTVDVQVDYGGRESVVLWERGQGSLASSPQARIQGVGAWGRDGIAVSQMGQLPASLYTGEIFDNNTGVLVPVHGVDLRPIWAFVASGAHAAAVRKVDRGIKVTNATLTKVPFDVEHWQAVADQEFPDGLPEPFSSDATQWLFEGWPVAADQPMQVAVARLLGFQWPDQDSDDLDGLADPDGVVCLPPVGGEPPAVDRLLEVLASAYGDQWSPAVLDLQLAQVGGRAGKAGLEMWLRNGFFKDHLRVFGNRPFIWQVWDGDPGGFSALVNYHRLDRALLERLTYDYLGSWWIGRVRDEVAREVPSAVRRLAAAEALQAKLVKILEGEAPFDIFVRWKSLAQQPLGWDPDLDDGVRLNIRPFVTADVLRARPSIKWAKDRGMNPNGSERINDLHYTLAQKRSARGEI